MDPSVPSLCYPWITTTNLSYRFPVLKLPPPPCAVLLVLLSCAAGTVNRIGVAASGCDGGLSANFLTFAAGNFRFKHLLKKCFKVVGFGATISDAVARSSIDFSCALQLSLCRSHSNGCVKVAYRRRCVRKDRKSYWSGCIKAAMVIH